MGRKSLLAILCTVVWFTAATQLQFCKEKYECFSTPETPYCCAVNATHNVCGTCHGSCVANEDCVNSGVCCFNKTVSEGNCYNIRFHCPDPVPEEPLYIPPEDTTTTQTTTTTTPTTTTTTTPSTTTTTTPTTTTTTPTTTTTTPTTTTTTPTTTRTPQCFNLHGCCPYWEQIGYCNSENGFMAYNCKAQCGRCQCDDPSRCGQIANTGLCAIGSRPRCYDIWGNHNCKGPRYQGCYTEDVINNCWDACWMCWDWQVGPHDYS